MGAPGMAAPGSPELPQAQMPPPSPLPEAKVNPFMTRGSLALLGMCAAGFIALYLLGGRSGPSAAMGEQVLVHAKVEAALKVMDSQPTAAELSKRTNAKAIADDFYTAARQRQVDRKQLERNPFVFKEKAPDAAPIELPREVEIKDNVPAELKAALEDVKGLRLQTVLVGRSPAALISNNLVTRGQVIKGWTVTRIDSREVELTWKDQKHVLDLPK
jgi:hypothetical protein